MRRSNFLIKQRYYIAILSAVVVLMWGLTAWLRMLADGVPPLELTGIAMAGAMLSSRLLPGTRGAFKLAVSDYPWYAWLAMGAGLLGGAVFYFVALAHAPPAQVVVITYSWPLLFAIASDVYSRRQPAPLTFLSLLLGLLGVFVMHGLGQSPSPNAWLGYASAVASGLCWVSYSLFLQIYPRPVTPVYPAFFAAAAVVAFLLQAIIGEFVWPRSPAAWTSSMILGVGPYGFGFVAWSYVVRHGNPRVVPMLPYAVPAVAAITLILIGRTQATLPLIVGCALVTAACAMSSRTGKRSGKA